MDAVGPTTGEVAARAIERLRNPAPGSKIAAARDFGVDLTLLIEQLKLSPDERARRMHALAIAAEQARGVARRRQPIIAHMATAVLIPIEEYLATAYRPDCDYIDGEVRERNVGELKHARFQTCLVRWLGMFEASLGIWAVTELRVQVRPGRFRIPDVTVTLGEPSGRFLTSPPFLVIEILSERDTLRGIQDRIDDYKAMGVPHVWVIDPETLAGWDASTGSVVASRDGVLRTSNPEIVARLAEIAD